jgi:hypothetical protein
MHLVHRITLAVTLAAVPVRATAATEADVPAKGSMGALAVRVDLAAKVVRYQSCAAAPCPVGSASPSLRIDLDPAALPEAASVTVEPIDVGEGKHLVHVRVPTRGAQATMAPAWEALLAANAPEPIFAGVTGWTHGEEGERQGTLL